MNTLITGLLLTAFPLLEIVFATSPQPVFSELRLIYICVLFLLLIKRKKLAVIYVVSATSVIEIVTFQTIVGYSSLSFFISLALVELVYRLSSFLSQENLDLKISIVFVVALIVRHQLLLLLGGTSIQFDFTALFMNGVILVIAIFLAAKIRQPVNAFKK